MNNKTENILILAGVGIAGAYLLSSTGSGTSLTSLVSTPAANQTAVGEGYPYVILPNAPPPPATYNQDYYITYQYPAMLKANPNVGNPNYQMTDAEANQYYANYVQLQQWANSPTGANIPHNLPNLKSAMQFHWSHYGVANQMSFMPFLPTDGQAWTPPPVNPNTKPSTQSWIGTALSIATTVAAILSAPPQLNDAEAEVLINGSAIGLNILPFYFEATDGYASAALGKMEDLLAQYTK